MRVLRPGALLGAFLIATPTIYAAFVSGTATPDAAIVRFLIGVIPCGIALGLLDGLLDMYTSGVGRKEPRVPEERRRSERAES